MKNKDKRIKELEEQKTIWIMIAFLTGTFFLLQLVISIYTFETYGHPVELSEQLQLCQEKIPIWTLNIYCEDFEDSRAANITMEFDSYEKYQRTLNQIIEEETCEVIE